MLQQHPYRPASGPSAIADAIAAAEWQARRLCRRCGCSSADEEDFRQAILVDLIARADRFEPVRGSWPAFVRVVTEHAASRIARNEGRRAAYFSPLADQDEPIDDRQRPGSNDLAIDFAREIERLPRSLRGLVDLIAETGTVAGARRASPLSPASFFRALRELRLRLLAAGFAGEGGTRRRS